MHFLRVLEIRRLRSNCQRLGLFYSLSLGLQIHAFLWYPLRVFVHTPWSLALGKGLPI